MKRTVLIPVLATLGWSLPRPAAAQRSALPGEPERVTYQNPHDRWTLTGTLVVPAGEGPFPGVVLLSLSSADDLIERLNRRGWAVLQPARRGLGGTPEHFLQASFENLALDIHTAVDYLRSRPEVAGRAVGIVAQGGETLAALTAAATPPDLPFVVLLAPAAFPGDEDFQREQHRLAQQQGYSTRNLEQLDEDVAQLGEIIKNDPSSVMRETRIRRLMTNSNVKLPYNPASFPTDPDVQVHFLSSQWWHDYMRFQPEELFARSSAPLLVLLGTEDPLIATEGYLPSLQRALEGAPSDDVTTCVLPGRTQHLFSSDTGTAILEWLRLRVVGGDGSSVRARPGADPPSVCLKDPPSFD